MNILGINAVYHESAAALLVDGELVAAVEEERFNRIKHGKEADFNNPHQFPERAIRYCLNHAGLTAADIDHVAYTFDPRCAASDIALSGGIPNSRKPSGCGSARSRALPRSSWDASLGKNFISSPIIWRMPPRRISRP